MGAYVKLLEYDNIDGMILLSELSRRRIRSIQKLIRIGRNEVVVVLRVDKEKGYIDLSKRRVSAEDIGIITITDTLTFIDILNGKGAFVLKAMQNTAIGGKQLKVTQHKKS